jgi:uncharacterized protein (TIGR03086 family)
MTTTHHRTEIAAVDDAPAIRIARRFSARPERVFRAHVDPALVVRWLGPRDLVMEIERWDCATGGAYRYVHRRGDEAYRFFGSFHEVRPSSLIVQTFTWEGSPDEVALERATFVEVAPGVTEVVVISTYEGTAARDAMLASGMEGGVRDGYERLDALLGGRAVTPAERYDTIARAFDARVRAVPDASWDAPAPCAGWVARDVVRHLAEWIPGFFGSAAGVAFPPMPSADADPVGAWTALDGALRATLADAAVAEREFDSPMGRSTVAVAIDRIATSDVFVHTWDLARAAGLDDRIDPHEAAAMLAGMEPMDTALRASGHYGPRVPVDDGADAVARLVAFTGRDPAWRPPG